MDLYAENILDHYRNPRGKERIGKPTVTHEEINTSCGDSITLDLLITDGRIQSLGWTGEGCAISQAAMSIMHEELLGMSVEDAKELSANTVYDWLGVPVGPRRVKCALLALHALKNALHQFSNEPLQGWPTTIA